MGLALGFTIVCCCVAGICLGIVMSAMYIGLWAAIVAPFIILFFSFLAFKSLEIIDRNF